MKSELRPRIASFVTMFIVLAGLVVGAVLIGISAAPLFTLA
ncbi:hypothetical protein [Devosia sp.]